MLDKDWLERVSHAYKVYAAENGENSNIKKFITWLYFQYGIFEPNKDKE